MEKIINNPGLQHLAEKVFSNLNVEDMKICAEINQSCKQILENPMFWLRKFEGCLSKENQREWIKIIQSSVENSKKEKSIISYLQWNLKKNVLVDLPCYTCPSAQNEFKEKIWESCKKKQSEISEEDVEIVKIFAPWTDNPNALYKDEELTAINMAACNGHTEIVKVLAPLTDNPNAPDNGGRTPIWNAASHGYTEIVKVLAPLTDNPNAPPK